METILEAIKSEFGRTVAQLDWMSDQTKERALEKLASVNNKIAFPPIAHNISQLEQYYAKVRIAQFAAKTLGKRV